MRNSFKILGILAIVISLFNSQQAIAGDIAIVVNKSVNVGDISQKDLKRLFLGKTRTLADAKVKPVVLSSGNAARDSFNSEILKMSANDLKAYWIKESLKGGAKPPKSLKNPGSLVKYVKKKKGAIGYLNSSDAATSGLKVVAIR